MKLDTSCTVAIIGGGNAGISLAARLRRAGMNGIGAGVRRDLEHALGLKVALARGAGPDRVGLVREEDVHFPLPRELRQLGA